MTLGSSPLGATPLGSSGVDSVIKAVELSSDIPPDAKKAIKDFVKESFQNLWESLEELINLDPPTELVEYWDLVKAN
jgi:hypothetical protein